jgi:hypothetical protein
LLTDANRKPVKIRTGRRKIDRVIPSRGTASPEKRINPIDDPARSEL